MLSTRRKAAFTLGSPVAAANTRSRWRCSSRVANVALAPAVIGYRRSEPVATSQAPVVHLATAL